MCGEGGANGGATGDVSRNTPQECDVPAADDAANEEWLLTAIAQLGQESVPG
jgi:hypothetical protein